MFFFFFFFLCICISKYTKQIVDDHFGESEQKEETQQHGQKRVGKRIEKLLSPSGKNNGSQIREINKWALRKQTDLKEPGERPMGSM